MFGSVEFVFAVFFFQGFELGFKFFRVIEVLDEVGVGLSLVESLVFDLSILNI